MRIQVKTTISGGGRDLGPTGGQVTQVTIGCAGALGADALDDDAGAEAHDADADANADGANADV